jgi:hypothetical protein
LRGKKVRCKLCKTEFVVGGAPAATSAPRPAAASAPRPAAAPQNDLAFEDDTTIRPRGGRRQGSGIVGIVIVFLLMFGLGGGAMAGYLWMTKPAEEETTKKSEPEKPHFAWLAKGTTAKEKDPPTTRDKDKKKDADKDRKKDADKDRDKGNEDPPFPVRLPLPPEVLPPQMTTGIPTRENWSQLVLGQTEAEVVRLLGPPHGRAPDNLDPTATLLHYYIGGRESFVLIKDGKFQKASDPLQSQIRPDEWGKVRLDISTLKMGAPGTWDDALRRLAQAPYSPMLAPEASVAIENVARGSGPATRLLAVKALKTWGKTNNVPYLLSLLDLPPGNVPLQDNIVLQTQWEATQAIVHLQDVRGPRAAAHMMRTPYKNLMREFLEHYSADYGYRAALYCCNDADAETHAVAEEMLTRFNTPQREIALQSARDLNSPTVEVKTNALTYFQRHPPGNTGVDPALREQIAGVLEKVALEPENPRSLLALDVLARWGVRANLPALSKLAKDGTGETQELARLAINGIRR